MTALLLATVLSASPWSVDAPKVEAFYAESCSTACNMPNASYEYEARYAVRYTEQPRRGLFKAFKGRGLFKGLFKGRRCR